MDFQERKPIANQFSVRHSNILSPFREIYIIEGHFTDIGGKSGCRLALIAVYFHHIQICYHIYHIKGCYKKWLFPCKKHLQKKGVAKNLQIGCIPPLLLCTSTPCWLTYVERIVMPGYIPPATLSSFWFLPPWSSPSIWPSLLQKILPWY